MKKPVADSNYKYISALLSKWCENCSWSKNDLRKEIHTCPECGSELSKNCVLKFGGGEIQFRATKECFDISSGQFKDGPGHLYAPDITDVTVFILRHLTWWRGEETGQPVKPINDKELIGELPINLPIHKQTNILKHCINSLISNYILKLDPERTKAEEENLIHDEINNRLRSCYSRNTFAQEIFSMAKDRFFDFEEIIFPDGIAEAVLVSELQLPEIGENILINYLSFIDAHPELELIHPNDFSSRHPKAINEKQEWDRHVKDFTNIVSEWRDKFIRRLLVDCSKSQAQRQLL